MNEESALRERLRKIDRLFARPGGEGERLAAGAARDRLRRRLAEIEARDPPIWSRLFLLALRGLFSPWEIYH